MLYLSFRRLWQLSWRQAVHVSCWTEPRKWPSWSNVSRKLLWTSPTSKKHADDFVRICEISINDTQRWINLHLVYLLIIVGTWTCKLWSTPINHHTKWSSSTILYCSRKERLDGVFSFLEDGGSGVKADKSGAGLLKVWKLQLQQLHNLGQDMTAAIASEFPSPLALRQVAQFVKQ